MNVSRKPSPRRRVLRWIGMLVLVVASGCRDHGGSENSGGGGSTGGGGSASSGDWDLLVWDQSNWR
jgi:hypothetical protein